MLVAVATAWNRFAGLSTSVAVSVPLTALKPAPSLTDPVASPWMLAGDLMKLNGVPGAGTFARTTDLRISAIFIKVSPLLKVIFVPSRSVKLAERFASTRASNLSTLAISLSFSLRIRCSSKKRAFSAATALASNALFFGEESGTSCSRRRATTAAS